MITRFAPILVRVDPEKGAFAPALIDLFVA